MFAKLKQIFGAGDPDLAIASDLERMMGLAELLVKEAGKTFFDDGMTAEARDAFYATDQEINRLEQKVRRQVISRITLTPTLTRPRWLGLLGLVKDVERIGDYGKNLLEAALLREDQPASAAPAELSTVRAEVEAILSETLPVLLTSDEDGARNLLDRCHTQRTACENLIRTWARSDAPASVAVPVVLALRSYKRIAAHTMNILSSVVMPLDRVGYHE